MLLDARPPLAKRCDLDSFVTLSAQSQLLEAACRDPEHVAGGEQLLGTTSSTATALEDQSGKELPWRRVGTLELRWCRAWCPKGRWRGPLGRFVRS